METYADNFGKGLTLMSYSGHDEVNVHLNPTKEELTLISEILTLAKQRYEMLSDKEGFSLSVETIQNFEMQAGNYLNSLSLATAHISSAKRFSEHAALLLRSFAVPTTNGHTKVDKQRDKDALKRISLLLYSLERLSTGNDQVSKYCQNEFLKCFFKLNSGNGEFDLRLNLNPKEVSLIYSSRLKEVLRALAKAQPWRVLELLSATGRIDSSRDPTFFEEPEKLIDDLFAQAERNMFLDPRKYALLLHYYRREGQVRLQEKLNGRLEAMGKL